MAGGGAFVPSFDTLAYLSSLALVVSVLCGLGLLAVRALRKRAAPLRHGVLLATLTLLLLAPIAVWLGQRNGLVLIQVKMAESRVAAGGETTEPHATSPAVSHGFALPDGRMPGEVLPPVRGFGGGVGTVGIYEPREDLITASASPSHRSGVAVGDISVSVEESLSLSGPAKPAVEPREPMAWWQVVGGMAAWAWAVGCAVGLVRLGWGYIALARFCHRLVPLSDPRQKLLVHEAADAFGLKRLPAVYLSRAAAVPMSIGMFRPAVVLPASMPCEHDQQHLQAVLLHEMAHIARRDHWVGLAQRIAGTMFWWNPLCHWANDLLSELREEICDNHVIKIQGEGNRLARVLVDLAAQVASVPLLPSTVGVLEPRLAGLTGRVTRLLTKERNMDTRMSIRWRVLLLTCGIFTLTAMALVGGVRLADAEPVATPGSAVEEAEEDASATGGRFDFRGKVLDPEGKPLAGANIYVVFYTNPTHPQPPAPKVRTTSGTDGTFHFTMDQAEFDKWREAHPWGILDDVSFRNDTRIVAQAAGYGPVWLPAFQFDRSGQLRQRMLNTYPEEAEAIGKEREPVLQVVKDDVPLVGRVVDTRGRPISGVNVRVAGIRPVIGEDLTEWLETAGRKDATVVAVMHHTSIQRTAGGSFSDGAMNSEVLPQIMPGATTDADGRVCLRGIGRERLALLRIEGPEIESAVMVYGRTRPGETIRLPYNVHWKGNDITFYGADFEHVAPASVSIEGTVRDLKSGAPLAGVTIQAYKMAGDSTPSYVAEHYFRATTDAEGRYRLRGIPIGEGNELLAVPPQGEPYLMSKKSVDTAEGKEAIRADFELMRGVLIQGRVTDAKTGTGVVNCTVDYYVFRDNPHLEEAPGFDGASKIVGPYMTDKEGRYAVPGLPGRGIVAVQLFSDRLIDYPLQAGVETIPELSTSRRSSDSFVPAPLHIGGKHAVAAVDLADGEKSHQLDFQLHPTPLLSGTVLDPEGKPLAGVHCRGATERGGWRPLDSAEFSVHAFRSEEPRTLLFVHLERKLSGSLVLDGEQTEKLTVRLQPWASVSGRLVDSDGNPIPAAELWGGNLPVHLWVKQPNGEMVEAVGTHVTDADGRFYLEGLAPGIRYSPVVFDRRESKASGAGPHVVDLKPGEARVLGDVKVLTPEQRRAALRDGKTSAARVQAPVDPSRWQLHLELDAADLEPQVVQYAIFDEDPVPGFRVRVARQRGFHERQLAQHAGDTTRVQAIRRAGMTVNWDLVFKDVTGNDVRLLVSAPNRFHSMMSNGPDGKKWIVSRSVLADGEPVCWCLPVEVKKGKAVTLTLTEDNAFDLKGAFESAMEEE